MLQDSSVVTSRKDNLYSIDMWFYSVTLLKKKKALHSSCQNFRLFMMMNIEIIVLLFLVCRAHFDMLSVRASATQCALEASTSLEGNERHRSMFLTNRQGSEKTLKSVL